MGKILIANYFIYENDTPFLTYYRVNFIKDRYCKIPKFKRGLHYEKPFFFGFRSDKCISDILC